MSELVLLSVCDGDACEIMARTPYSTDPRSLITIMDMEVAYYENHR
jgi:hypothetical protein